DCCGDIRLDWTHLNSFDDGSAVAPNTPHKPGLNTSLGPSFLIGPPTPFSSANAVAHFAYDAVDLDAGLFLRPYDHVQLRTFAGVQFARISQSVTTNFRSPDGSISFTDVPQSVFTGAGPRLGANVQYLAGKLGLLGEMAGSLLIGTMQSHIAFVSADPIDTAHGLIPNNQYLNSPSSTRVVPSIDAKLGASYAISVGNRGLLKFEAGY